MVAAQLITLLKLLVHIIAIDRLIEHYYTLSRSSDAAAACYFAGVHVYEHQVRHTANSWTAVAITALVQLEYCHCHY
jgi:hypothetical protein